MKTSKQSSMSPVPELNLSRRISKWFSQHCYVILYIIILFVLWGYIILNWERCISMKFFSEFDGENILFLVGIILTILPFYDVEGKGFKIKNKVARKMDEEVQTAHSQYRQNQIKNMIIPQTQNSKNQSEEASYDE